MPFESTIHQEAADPGTPAARLRDIAQQRSTSPAAAVAANPSAPPDLLAALVRWQPEGVLRNPALPRILLENPSWAEKLPIESTLYLMKPENAPAKLLQAFVNRPGHAGQAARLHVGLAGECGADWKAEAREALWDASGFSRPEESFPARLLALGLVAEWLTEPLAAHGESQVRRAAVRTGLAPRDTLAMLRRAGGTPDLGAIARPDPSIPSETLERLARGGAWARRLAARNPNTPIQTLQILALEPEEAIRWDLFKNPSSTEEMRASFIPGLGSRYQRAMARAPETPPAVLETLAGHENRDVRWMAARNPNTPLLALTRLSEDTDARVRQGVGRNFSAPSNLLARLARDPVRWVRLAAARHWRTPADALALLDRDEDEEVRESVARRNRPSAPSREPTVRVSVKSMTTRMNKSAVRTAAPRSPIGQRDPREAARVLEMAMMQNGWLAQAAALSCPEITPKHISGGAANILWPCRLAVARNPAAFLFALEQPDLWDVLQRLTHDGNRLVRAAARAALEESGLT